MYFDFDRFEKEIAIMMSAGNSKQRALRQLERGAVILEASDYITHIVEYEGDGFEDEFEENELRELAQRVEAAMNELKGADDGFTAYIDEFRELVAYDREIYIICYVL